MRRLLALLVALLPVAASAAEEPPISPRLLALQKQVQQGDAAAVASFWKDVTAHGTPLVEPAPDRPDYSLVTFLWRGDPTTKSALVSTLEQRELVNRDALARGVMARLGDTDVWYRTQRLRSDARFTYQLSPNDPLTLLTEIPREGWAKRRASFVTDPLNARQFETRNGMSSVVELPAAPPQPWLEKRAGVAAGRLVTDHIPSAILGKDHAVTVYTPAGYDPARGPYPLVVLFDASTYLEPVPGPVILDNLIAAGRVKAPVVVFVENGGGAERVRELTHNEAFADFLAKELLPWVRQRYAVTSDRRQIVLGGSSIGATAAAFAALRHPEAFGNVLSQSGGYQAAQQVRDDFKAPAPGLVFEEDFPEYEWLSRQFAARAIPPVRFWLEIGLREEVGWQFPIAPYALSSAVDATRHLRDVLTARGHEVHYREFNGGHEVLCWRGSLADGLLALLGT